MRILAVWDNETEAELISMYLGIEENELTMTTVGAPMSRLIGGFVASFAGSAATTGSARVASRASAKRFILVPWRFICRPAAA